MISQDPNCPYLDRVSQVYTPRFILLLDEPRTHFSPSLYCHQPLIRGLISKESSPELIKASIDFVLAGGTCFSNRTEALSPLSSPTQPEDAELLGLTKRQYEVLVLLAKGYPLKTVAKQLRISLATAKSHTETLYQRLNVNSRNEAVCVAMNKGATLCWPQQHPT